MLETIQQEVGSVRRIAVIKDKDDMLKATETLSKLNVLLDNLKKDEKLLTEPLNKTLDEIKGRYKPTKTVLESEIARIRSVMSVYQTEQVRIQKEEEAKIASRIGEGKGKIKFETATKKMSEIERVDNVVSSDVGTVRFSNTKVLKVVDMNLIPDEYFDLNETKLLKVLKAGVVVAGAVLEDKLIAVNKR